MMAIATFNLLSLSTNKESTKVIKFIREYYGEFGKTPSMKAILKECDVNPRVFYQLFESQEEAFKLAGVPYDDEARIKVEKANVARKVGKNVISVIRTYPPIKVISRYDLMNKIDEPYVNKYDILMEKLFEVYSNYNIQYPNDYDSINEAYNKSLNFIFDWTCFLMMNDRCYELAKSTKYSNDPDRFYLIMLGYDINDLEGSNKKLLEKEFNKLKTEKVQWIFNLKTKEYFIKMINEVFDLL